MEASPQARVFEGRLVYSVFSITRRIRDNLEGDEDLVDVWVEGEISGFKLHRPSGHYYFSVKDEQSQINCACFRSSASAIPAMTLVKDGDKVLIRGDVSVYEARGTYNVRVRGLRIVGKGELFLLYEKMKKKLEKEGLFNTEHKKPLPMFPSTIGVVTSESGAALQDILNILSRRYPLSNIILSPAKVQGEGAAKEIAQALQALDKSGQADVIIAGRGGGSMEDLWCFNEEIVARTIFECRTPVVSAVGHEIDFTIADFVADKRAPTPSAAAELVVPDIKDILATLFDWDRRLDASSCGQIESLNDRLISLQERLESRSPAAMVEQGHLRCDDLEERLDRIILSTLERWVKQTIDWEERLQNAAISSTLDRGYILARSDTGDIVSSAKSLEREQELILMFKDGKARVKILDIKRGDEENE